MGRTAVVQSTDLPRSLQPALANFFFVGIVLLSPPLLKDELRRSRGCRVVMGPPKKGNSISVRSLSEYCHRRYPFFFSVPHPPPVVPFPPPSVDLQL